MNNQLQIEKYKIINSIEVLQKMQQSIKHLPKSEFAINILKMTEETIKKSFKIEKNT